MIDEDAHAALVDKWESAKALLVEVNEQNKALRAQLSKQAAKSRDLADELKIAKRAAEDALRQADVHVRRADAATARVAELDAALESLAAASSGAENDAQMRVADARRATERLERELGAKMDDVAAAEHEAEQARRALRDARAAVGAEAARADAAEAGRRADRIAIDAFRSNQDELELRIRELERQLATAEGLVQEGASRYQVDGRGNSGWMERLGADPSATKYLGVVLLITFVMLYVFVTTRS